MPQEDCDYKAKHLVSAWVRARNSTLSGATIISLIEKDILSQVSDLLSRSDDQSYDSFKPPFLDDLGNAGIRGNSNQHSAEFAGSYSTNDLAHTSLGRGFSENFKARR